MREYERACACCSFRFAPSGEELYCGPCGRARVLPDYPLGVTQAVFDKDFARYSGHECPLLWTAEEQRLAERAMRRAEGHLEDYVRIEHAIRDEYQQWERELRDRRPDTQRDDWEQR